MNIKRLQIETLFEHVLPPCIFGCSLAVFILTSGCENASIYNRQASTPAAFKGFFAPDDFIRKITPADRIVVTNRFADIFPEYQGFSFNMSGRKVKTITHAITMLKAYPNELGSASLWDWQLQFFKGTNCLGTANFAGKSIIIDREYCDKTGVFEKLYKEVNK